MTSGRGDGLTTSLPASPTCTNKQRARTVSTRHVKTGHPLARTPTSGLGAILASTSINHVMEEAGRGRERGSAQRILLPSPSEEEMGELTAERDILLLLLLHMRVVEIIASRETLVRSSVIYQAERARAREEEGRRRSKGVSFRWRDGSEERETYPARPVGVSCSHSKRRRARSCL